MYIWSLGSLPKQLHVTSKDLRFIIALNMRIIHMIFKGSVVQIVGVYEDSAAEVCNYNSMFTHLTFDLGEACILLLLYLAGFIFDGGIVSLNAQLHV